MLRESQYVHDSGSPARERDSTFAAEGDARESIMTPRYAPPQLRDRFLRCIESADWKSSAELATDLMGCTNPLPGLTCTALQLALGSTYGAAAERVLQLNRASPAATAPSSIGALPAS